MDWQRIIPWVLAALAWLWKHGQAVVAEAVAAAEKRGALADGKLTNEELEQIAVDVTTLRWPFLPEVTVRWAIRRVCRNRKPDVPAAPLAAA